MNSDFYKRLFAFQAKPPAKTWKEIARALDEGTPALADRLFHYQAIPSADIWAKINARLNRNSGGALVVMRRNKWVTYGAAAVLIVLAGYGLYLLAPGDKTQPTTTLPAAITGTIPPSPGTSNSQNKSLPESVVEAKNTVAIVPTVPAKKRNMTRHLTARVATTVRKPEASFNASKKAVPLPEKNIVNASRDDRYMIATANDGKVVRLPKKAYAAFACVEVTDIACREKIASMQNKMATASLSADFAGFLDLLNKLQDQ